MSNDTEATADDQNTTDDSAMQKRIPLKGEIDPFGRKERYRHVAGRFTQSNIPD